MRVPVLTVAALLLLSGLPASAQQSVTLQFNAGLVTLRAQNAPIRAILAEWARLGGSTIVNGDTLAGPPVTLELTGVSEQQALDIVLREAAGYMLAPRRAASTGASAYDRILILPTSVAPRTPPPVVTAGGPRPGLPRPPGLVRPPAPDVQMPPDVGVDDADLPGPQDSAPGNPQGDDPRLVLPGFGRRPPAPGADPDGDDPPDETGAATSPGVAPTPANPFGIPLGSSTTPGAITPVAPPRPSPDR